MANEVVKQRSASAAVAAIVILSARLALAQDATPTAPPAATETPSVTPAEAPAPPPISPEVAEPPPAPVAAALPAPLAAPPPTTPAPSPSSPGLKPTASFFTRYEGRERFAPLGAQGRFAESDLSVYRARLGLATTPIDVGVGEQVVIQFTPQASGIVGTLNGTVVDASLGLHEGYLRLQGEHHKFDAGRFEMNYGDSLIIGNLDWHETARSFDGMRLRLTPTTEKTFVDVFVTQATTTATAAEGGRAINSPFLGAGDSYFAGVYAGLGGFIDPAMELEPYFLALIAPGTDTPGMPMAMPPTPTTHRNPSTLFTLGTRFKHVIDTLDVRAEGGLQFGGIGQSAPIGTDPMSGPSIFAYQLDAEVGISVMDKKLRLGVEGLIASGNDPTTADKSEGWNQLFPTGHKFLGLMDIMGARSNVASGVLHVAAMPTADVKILVDGHVYSRLEDFRAVPMMMGQTGAGLAGFEVDAGLVYALGAGLNVRGLYGIFVPSEDTLVAGSPDPAHYVEIELRYDLK